MMVRQRTQSAECMPPFLAFNHLASSRDLWLHSIHTLVSALSAKDVWKLDFNAISMPLRLAFRLRSHEKSLEMRALQPCGDLDDIRRLPLILPEEATPGHSQNRLRPTPF